MQSEILINIYGGGYRNHDQDVAGDDLEGSKDICGELQRKAAAEQRAGGRAHLRLLSIGDCCLDFFNLKEIFPLM